MSKYYAPYYTLQRYKRPLKLLSVTAAWATAWFCISAIAQVTEAVTAAKAVSEIANLPMTGAALAVAGIAATGMIFVTKWAFGHISDSLRLQGATNERLARMDDSISRVARALETKPCIAVNPVKVKGAFEES